MGLADAITVMKNLYKAMKPGDKIVAYLKSQQGKGAKLSPRLRNAMAMYDLSKTEEAPEPKSKDLYSFSDSAWYFLDIRDELAMTPDLLPANLADAFSSYRAYIDAAQAAGERSFDKERAKWEKKNRKTYQPKPRINLIGEPLE